MIRYFQSRSWAEGFLGREPFYTYRLATDIEAAIYESDPMWLAVFLLNGIPVAGESCIVNHEEWAMRVAEDTDLLTRLRTLFHPP